MLENSHPREEPQSHDSNHSNNKNLFKKQKSYSTAYGEQSNEVKEHNQQQRNQLAGKAFGLKKIVEKQASQQQDGEKRGMIGERINNIHSTNDPSLHNFHKKSDSFDKTGLTNKKSASTSKGSNNKFYLNTNLKMFHFKSNSRHMDSGSKRSPSFSNSQLATDLPSNKVGSTSNSSRPIMTTQKVIIGSKEKQTQMKQAQQNIFEDFKSYTIFKSSINHHAKFVANVKYPYFFDDLNDNNNENDDHSKVISIEEQLFEKANNPKKFQTWKDDVKKRLEAQRNKVKQKQA